jgi:DegV family protein with EDD domain
MSERPAVRVVTDSTACLSDAAASGVVVVPLRVLAGEEQLREGVEISPGEVAERIAAGERLTTSQPPPADFLAAFRDLADAGARAVVTVHLSGELSGTVESAGRAAQRAMLPVRVVDSRTVAGALGFAATEAAHCAADGHDAAHVAARAEEVARSSETLFLVDSLDHLRRGGRLSAPAAALGTALGVRPLLGVRDGRVALLQRVRTRAAATDRMVERAARHAERCERPGIAVHHLGAEDRADAVAAGLRERLGADVVVTPVSAVLGAHAGPGALAVAVADLGGHAH